MKSNREMQEQELDRLAELVRYYRKEADIFKGRLNMARARLALAACAALSPLWLYACVLPLVLHNASLAGAMTAFILSAAVGLILVTSAQHDVVKFWRSKLQYSDRKREAYRQRLQQQLNALAQQSFNQV